MPVKGVFICDVKKEVEMYEKNFTNNFLDIDVFRYGISGISMADQLKLKSS